MNGQQLFFCGGLPKSGTTFLQRIINMHPEISCQSEDNLDYLARRIRGLIKDYNQVLNTLAKRTGADEYSLVNNDIFNETFINLIKSVAINRNDDKKFIGINDNHLLIYNLSCIMKYFKGSKIIIIFRNPIDRALSAWDHNLRLNKKEVGGDHLDFLKTNGKLDLDAYVIKLSKIWSLAMLEIIELAHANGNSIRLVSYELLVNRKKESLENIFKFIGCTKDEQVVSGIVSNSSLGKMRDNSSSPIFFSKARMNFGEGVLKPSTIKSSLEISKKAIQLLNIEIPQGLI